MRWAQTGQVLGQEKKLVFGTTEISRKTGGAEVGGVSPLRVTFRSTRNNILNPPPPQLGDGPGDLRLCSSEADGRRGPCTPLAELQFRALQFRGGGAAGGVPTSLSQFPRGWASPQAHLRKAERNAKRNRTSPKRGTFAQEAPGSPTRQRSLLPQPQFSPRVLAGTQAAKEGLLPRGPISLRLLVG